jgi:drug/metabolite transporter (DMT)-like permease
VVSVTAHKPLYNDQPAGDPGARLKVIAAFATIYLVWGSTFLAIRIGVRHLPPFLFGGLRFLLAGTLLAVVALVMRERFPRSGREWRLMLLFSLLMITFSNGISTVALQYVPSNQGALLAASSALWIAALGALGPKGHALTVRGSLGLLCGFVGVGLIVWPREAMAAGQVGWQALILIGSFSWAVGTILYRDASLAVGPVAFNAVMMLFGGTWLVLAGLATGELPRWEWRPGGLVAMLYLAVFGSALAYTAYSWLLKRVPADRVGTFAYVNPAVATVLGWAILGESLGPLQVAGMVVVLLGVALVTLPGRLA